MLVGMVGVGKIKRWEEVTNVVNTAEVVFNEDFSFLGTRDR